METKLKPAPTTMPKGIRAVYEFVSNPDPYEGEAEDGFQSRKNIYEAYRLEMVRQGLSIDDLVAIEMGITMPPKTAVSPLLNSLIQRI